MLKEKKKLLIALVIIGATSALIGSFFVHSTPAKADTSNPGTCTLNYADKKNVAWTYQGYQYEVFEFRLSGKDTNNQYYINSRSCSDSDANDPDRIVIAETPSLLVNGKKPIGAELGVPRHPVSMGNYNNGHWQSQNVRGHLTPVTRVGGDPLPDGYGSLFNESHNRTAAAVDDSGRFVLESASGVNSQIFCVNMVTSPLPAGAINCSPDIKGTTTQQGAGTLLRPDNCVDGIDLGGTAGGPSINYSCASPNVGKWFMQNGQGTTNLTNMIGLNGDGTLRDFEVHLDGWNTKPGGFSVSVIMTFKYPTGYNNQATLAKCGGQGNSVNAGGTVCLAPGMKNEGDTASPGTYVELAPSGRSASGDILTAAQINSYLAQDGTQPTGSDLYPGGRGYDTGCMSNGECGREHYWWARTQSPPKGSPTYSIQYQPTYLRISSSTPAGTTICFNTLVTRATASVNVHTSTQECYGVGGPPTVLLPCPDSNLPANARVTVVLPDTAPHSPDRPFGNFAFIPGLTYNQDVRQGKTRVDANEPVLDNSSGGSRVLATVVPGSDTTYERVVLDYTPYISAYPFDNNRPAVRYDSYYNRTRWETSRSVSGYECNPGDAQNDPMTDCGHWYATSRSETCPSGYWLGSPGDCVTVAGRSSTPPHCPAGWDDFIGSCWDHAGSTVRYTCNSGDTKWDDSSCIHFYQGRAYYNWNKLDATPIERKQSSIQYDTLQMSPCHKRTYNAIPTAGTASLIDNGGSYEPENPTLATFTANVSVTFGVSQNTGWDPMRQASRINDLPHTVSYYIERANGSSTSPVDMPGSHTYTTQSTSKNVNVNSGQLNYSISARVPTVLQVGDRVCWTIYSTSRTGGSRAFGHMDINGNYVNNTGSGMNPSGSCSPRVVNNPYLRVYGGDVLAGSGFGVGCQVDTTASIMGWNRGDGSGSSVQFAAQAATSIAGSSSATARVSAVPGAPKGLTFGNTVGDVTFGGGFGAGQCAKDYFANAPEDDTEPNGYTISDRVNAVPLGARQVVYVDGDVFIRGNIVYAGNGTWSNLAEIPSYYLIACGNIYISELVTQLDGVYVAQPRVAGTGCEPDGSLPSEGRIYTCVDHNSRQVRTSSPDAFDRCSRAFRTLPGVVQQGASTKLTINGAFIANQVRFLRTNGSLRDSSPGEQASSATIAEVFNYSPELFLVNPGITTGPSGQYDSAAGLPPVL